MGQSKIIIAVYRTLINSIIVLIYSLNNLFTAVKGSLHICQEISSQP